jgi:hypothetical protein
MTLGIPNDFFGANAKRPPRPLGMGILCLGASFRCTTLRRRDS